ncbi:MAG: PAS domain S-box protein [Pseudomonadota bacterium]
MLSLFLVASAITWFLTLFLFFFQATRKTYPGFGYWTVGVGVIALGYLFYAVRGFIPLWVSVFFGTVAFPLGMVFHLEGIRRFLGLKPASKLWYALPLAVLVGLAVFYFLWNSNVWRTVVASVPIAVIHWTMAVLLVRSTVSPRLTFYRLIGSLLFLAGFLILGRAVWLVSAADSGLLWKAPLEFAFFISFVVIHLGENLSLIMLNAERVERDLLDAQADLSNTVRNLEQALIHRKQTDEWLRDSEEKYRTFFDTSRDCVFMTTVDGRFVDFNDVALETLGYAYSQRGEVLDHKVSDFYAYPEERDTHAALVSKVGFSKDYPVDLRKKDGTIIHTLITTVARKDSQGNIIGFQGTVRDVTEARKAAEALRISRHRLDQIIEFLPDPTIVIDNKGNVEAWNRGMEDLTGIPAQDMVGKGDHEYALPFYGERRPILLDLALNWNEDYLDKYISVVRREDGVLVSESHHPTLQGGIYLSGTARALYGSSGEPVGAIETLRNITAIKTAEEALRESERRLAQIVEFLPDPTMVIDRHGHVIAWNRAMEELTGAEASGVLGKADYEYAIPFYGIRRPIMADLVIDFNEEVASSYRYVKRDGNRLVSETFLRDFRGKGPVWFWNVAAPLYDQGGQVVGSIEVVRDITDLKSAEERAREMARRAEAAGIAKSEFLANMSHEIRTPISGVIGMSELLLDSELTYEQRRLAETIRSSAESLLGLINDVLDFSKIEAGKLDLENLDFDLRTLMDDFASAIAFSAHCKGLEFLLFLDPAIPVMLRGDQGRLRQILTNLVGNATKFTEAGEVVTCVGLESETEQEVVLRFAVRDTGIGVAQDKFDLLFDKFTQADASTTRKYGGAGLGLAISRQLAELMGGVMGLESEEGRGSEFWFTARLGKQPEANNREKRPFGHLEGMRVLIVDDNAKSREILGRQLSALGMRVSDAADGPSAIEALRRALDEEDPFHMALLDLHMPGMDGETLGRLIKGDPLLADITMALMPPLGECAKRTLLAEIGFAGCLTKPVTHQELSDFLSPSAEDPLAVSKTSGAYMFPNEGGDGQCPGEANNPRVLVVEDNLINRQVAVGILNRLGLRADVATDGAEALRALKSISYDLVLMDVQMPVMDGMEATREIRNPESAVLDHNVPVIAMTAHAMQGDRDKCLKEGMNDYISKPVSRHVLAGVLQKWLPGWRFDGRGPESEPSKASGRPVWNKAGMMERLMGDEDLAKEIVEAFLKDVPTQIEMLRQCVEQGDVVDVESRIHTLKGVSANVGGEDLWESAFQLEKAMKMGDSAAALERMTELEVRFGHLRDAMVKETLKMTGKGFSR